MAEKQRTLNAPVKLIGIGLHTGEKVNLTLCPAPENHGYKFQRVDLENEPIIPADCDLVVSTARGTTLEKDGARIYTCEHALAALVGMQVDNVLIQLDGPELPIMDGSSQPFVEAINSVGCSEQESIREYFEFKENVPFEDLDLGVEFLAVPYDEYRLTVMVDYRSPALGTQHSTIYKIDDFEKDIAPCRTFVFLKELETLADQGLIKGGDIDNAIVLVERENIPQSELDDLAKKLGKEDLQFEPTGIGTLNNCELRFANEPARHKLLDIIGDLALIGMPIKGHILAARPGHGGNVAFAKHIKGLIKEQKKENKRHFEIEKDPVYDINQIEKMLPHRYPFLMVDKILDLYEDRIVGVKNVTMNEPYFTGHFPGNPVMPGVLQIEAMAQVGGIFALNQVDEPEKYMTYFLKIDKVKFKRKVVPGDTVVFELKLLQPIRRGLVNMSGVAYVNGQTCAEADMLAQVTKEL